MLDVTVFIPQSLTESFWFLKERSLLFLMSNFSYNCAFFASFQVNQAFPKCSSPEVEVIRFE